MSNLVTFDAGCLFVCGVRIVDAWVEGDDLVLLSPSFRRLAIPRNKLKKRLGDDIEQLRDFRVDQDGSYMFWPHADVHLGWEHFLRLVDQKAALKAKQKHATFNKRYGAAIRTLRKRDGITQAKVQGITDRTLRRVEHGKAAASSATLSALAEAHGMDLNDYLDAVAKCVSS